MRIFAFFFLSGTVLLKCQRVEVMVKEMRLQPLKFSWRGTLSIQVRVASMLKRSRHPRSNFICLVLAIFSLGLPAAQFGFCQQASPVPSGEQIFSQRCSHCHGIAGEGISALTSIAGPSLRAEHNHGAVMRAIEVGPSHMPTFSYILPVQQMRSVADYVTSQIAVIPLAGGNLSDGGKLFRAYCATCHGAAVRGGALAFTGINAPKLTHKSKWIVAGTIRWGPGPMPAFPSSIIDDHQLASIVNYVEYVRHPPNPGGDPLNYYGPVAEGFVAWIMLLALVGFAVWIERGGKG